MVLAGIILAVASPYRFARLLVFLDPWSDPYGDGFQATVAIMHSPRAVRSVAASVTRP